MSRRMGIGFLTLLVCSLLPVQAQFIGKTYRQVNSSVVVIKTQQKEVSPWAQGDRFVNVGSIGSGVLISADGKVLTAAHVVQTADKILVEFVHGATVAARVLSSEPRADLALLQLEQVPPGVEIAPLGDSDEVQVGDRIFVVGAPFGISHSVTVGHISARRTPNDTTTGLWGTEFFQTDAAINQGNSGGPMFNMAGEVVGIVSHIISHSGGFEGLGFAATSNMAHQILLKRKPFWSGLDGFLLAGDFAKVFNLPTSGVLVQRIADNSPAATLGLRPGTIKATIGDHTLLLGGDIIVEVLGIAVAEDNSFEKIRDKIEKLGAGEQLEVKALRGGKMVELSMAMPER